MDPRDMAAMFGDGWPHGTDFDEKRMILLVPRYDEEDCEEIVEFPCKYKVCDLCHGTGTHVNPSIDAHGISAEEFHEDPDFHQKYMSGMYDVRCNTCHGKRVVPEVIREQTDPELLKWLDDWFQSFYEDRATRMSEMRYGC